MSIRVMSSVWEMSLPAKDKLVLLALADCANDEGLAWPSIATLARKCGCDERTIQRNLRELEKQGIFKREELVGRGCRYTFNPRQIATPGKKSPVTKTTPTPGKLPPNPSRTINKKKERAREHTIPDGWQPREFGLGTKSRRVVDGWPPGERETQVERFAAHHRARGNKFVDWQEAWSTWVLNSEKFKGGNNGTNIRTGSGQGPDKRSGLARAIDRELEALRPLPEMPQAVGSHASSQGRRRGFG